MVDYLPKIIFTYVARILLGAFCFLFPVSARAQHGALTSEEQAVWVEKALGAGTSHLNVLNQRRAQGEITELSVLVILADFLDQPADREAHPPQYYDELIFSRGSHPTGSVADFLAASSNGRLELTGHIRGWVTLPWKKNLYIGGAGGVGGNYPYNSQRLAEDAIAAVDTLFNFADIDNEGRDGIPDSGDDDETVDGIVIIHAGPGREGGSPNELTSVMWHTSQRLPVDGVFAQFFTLNPENSDIGILIHELGHLMGLPDLYDTVPPPSFGLGLWSVMSGGFTLGDGAFPADFDAYSKMTLGFADVVQLQANAIEQMIVPTQDNGVIYRLWSEGAGGPEFFLVEARRKSGLDRFIPGAGLFIYHIDDDINTNNNPERYLAALEQADGLYQLEGFYDDFSPGDEGDPFQEGGSFSRYTNPGSQALNHINTSVAISGIHGPFADGSMTADFFVEGTAHIGVPLITVVEAEGNGDGILQQGETAHIIPSLAVEELPAEEVILTLTPLGPAGTVVSGGAEYPLINVGPSFEVDAFQVVLEGPFSKDPQAVPFELGLAWKGSPGRIFKMEIGIGTNLGHLSNFNQGRGEWEHFLVVPGFNDVWSWNADRGTDNSGAFRAGRRPTGIGNFVDAALESPLFLLPQEAELLFDHKMDLPHLAGITTLIGGIVEISINGSSWKTMVPDGGYSHHFIGPFQGWRNQGVFAGLQAQEAEPGYKTVRIDLSEYGGASARVRFRLASSTITAKGTGWHIDNVRVQSAPTPVAILNYATEINGENLELYWEVSEPPLRTILWRGESLATAQKVGIIDAFDTHGYLVDRGGALRQEATYWLEFLNRDGTRQIWGPWEVEILQPLRLTVETRENGDTLFRWTGTVPESSTLDIYDVQGRSIWSFSVGRESAHEWHGQTHSGRLAAAGIYFARLSGTSLSAVKLVRISR